jgi:hypothetical protein
LLCNVTDELVTNALYDAPTTSDGSARHAQLSRSEPVSLAAHEVVDVSFCSDGETVGCAVHDPFGSLTVDTARTYLARCLRRGADQVSDRSGGAGLGLFTVLEASSHLVLNLAPGRGTECIALFHATAAFRGLSERPKSLSTFLLA